MFDFGIFEMSESPLFGQIFLDGKPSGFMVDRMPDPILNFIERKDIRFNSKNGNFG
jgi:hypothetical protein